MLTLQTVSLMASTVVSVVACLTIILKPFREWFFGVKSQNEGVKCLLRSEITKIYYGHIETRELREYEFQNLEKLYMSYKILKGNSFVDKIYKQMKEEWKIIK